MLKELKRGGAVRRRWQEQGDRWRSGDLLALAEILSSYQQLPPGLLKEVTSVVATAIRQHVYQRVDLASALVGQRRNRPGRRSPREQTLTREREELVYAEVERGRRLGVTAKQRIMDIAEILTRLERGGRRLPVFDPFYGKAQTWMRVEYIRGVYNRRKRRLGSAAPRESAPLLLGSPR